MKTLKTLKMLPLIGALATAMALAPVVSIAGDDDRGRGKDRVYQKHDGGKGHHRDAARSHRRDKGHYDRGHSHRKGHLARSVAGHVKHGGHKYVHNSHYKHGHKHHGHRHPHHGHKHTDYVVVHDHYRDYDPFRLMLGLHFDNIDIIYRDF
ncbi:MAG: hypothetical protein KJP10_06035 [Gammaproteobacteria bacterium]|nr:hypothetical protein [Gammaproteobacteria bacterium]